MSENDQTMDLQLPPSQPNLRQYVFPSAYGGAVSSSAPPQIHDLLGKLRREVGSVAAKKSAGGPMFPVRGARELNQKLADALNTLNMVASVVKQDVTIIPTETIPKNETKSGNPVFRTLAHVKATVRLIAPDTSYLDCVGSGHGGDVDDKSGGKASTYAWKDAIFKGLSIPHEDMVDTDDDSSNGDGETAGVRTASRKAAAAGSPGKGSAAKGQGESGAGAAGGSGGSGTSQSHSGVASSESAVGGQAVQSSNGNDLQAVLDAIKKADSKPALDAIRDDIKAGKYTALHGADKLKATQAWVAADTSMKKGS